MDTRTGEVYPSRQAALGAGVDPAFLVELNPATLAEAFLADTAPAGLRDRFTTTAGVRFRMGRNDPCPCGSGLKFKRCCLGKDAATFNARTTQSQRFRCDIPNLSQPPR